MTTYRICAPHFVAALVESGDAVIQAAPILHWTIGKHFSEVRDYCKNRGWRIEPLPESARPHWLEYRGEVFELHWQDDWVTRVSRHTDGEIEDITFDELPEPLRNLI
jgi:hypothetical protein